MSTSWIFVLVVVLLFGKPSTSLVYPSIQWTPRNPIFQKPEHSRVMNVQSMSRINIVCPNTATTVDIVQDSTPKEWLYENLWIVSKKSYDSCNASSKTDRRLLKCDTPLKLNFYSLIFIKYSATIQGLEFPVGQEYYFIATSDGTKASLDNRAGGNCARGSMKMRFYVCKGPADPRCIPSTTKKPQSNNQITDAPTPSNQPSKYIKTTQTTTTQSNAIQNLEPSSPTTRKFTTKKDKALQSDDPRTLHPTLSSLQSSTSVVPDTTTVNSNANNIEHLLNKEQCTHDHGMQPSWNVVIPLLVVIFILVIMNSFVICRLKQNTKSCLAEDDLNNVSKSYSLRNNNRKTSNPVMV